MKLLKKIAPLAVALLFTGTTVAAADLANWRASFPGADTAIVVGSGAVAEDTLGAVDIAVALGVTAEGETQVVGEAYWIKAPGDVFNYGDDLDEMTPTGLTDEELSMLLKEETFRESKGDNRNNVDYTQTIEFDPDAAGTLTLVLDNDENKANEPAGTYVFFDRGDNIYEYTIAFDEDVEFTNDDADDDFDNVKLKIQDLLFTITDVTEDGDALASIEMMSGALFATQGEYTTATYTLENKTYEVEVVIVSDDSLTAKFKVNGEVTDALGEGDTYTLADGIELGVDEVLPNEGSEEKGADIVSFYLGATKIELEDGGDVEINGQPLEDYTTSVTFTDTEGATGTLETIAIAVEPEDDLWLGMGESWVDPVFGNWKLTFSELSKKTEKIRLDVTGGDDGKLEFINNDGDEIEIPLVFEDVTDNVAFGNNEDYIDNNGVADADGEGIGNGGTAGVATAMAFVDLDQCAANNLANMENACDGFPFVVISAAGEARLYSIRDIVGDTGGGGCGAGECTVDVYDEQDNEVVVNDGSCDPANTVNIPGMGAVVLDCETAAAVFEFEDIDLAGTGDMETSLGGAIDLGITAGADEVVTVEIIDGAGNSDTHTIEDTAAQNEMTITPDAGLTWIDLEEDSDTELALDAANWGIIYTNKDTTEDNDLEIEYPEEIDDDSGISAKVYLAQLAATVVAGTGGVPGASVAVLDSELADVKEMNVVSIGGSAINRASAELLDLDFPTYGSMEAWQNATGVDGAGKAVIKMMESPWATGKMAMMVAGWEGVDTQRAAKALREDTLKSQLAGKMSAVLNTATSTVGLIEA